MYICNKSDKTQPYNYMKRAITQLLLDWRKRPKHKPLLIRGARQVGKTYIIERFGEEYFQNIVKINIEERPEIKHLFSEKRPKEIIKELTILFNVDIEPGKTLFFIDEIQESPEAIISLRYFYEQIPQLHIIAAGSLLDHTLSEIKQQMPVGRIDFLHMYPMSFTEFLWARSENKLADFLQQISIKEGITELLHKKFMEQLRYYYFVGGMPESVYAFTHNDNLIETERVHNSILNTLKYDFAKYGTRAQQQHLISTFRYVGMNAGKKIKYVNIDKETRSDNIKEALGKLEMSRLISKVKHSGASGVPLGNPAKEEIFKTIFVDIGLLNSMCKIQLTSLTDLLTANEGMLAEQFAGQEILSSQPAFVEPELYYWLREEKSSDAEIDYLIQHKNRIYPVEIKAGKSGTLKSLHVYLFEKNRRTGIRLNTDLPSIGTFDVKVNSAKKRGELKYTLLSLPLYMVSQLDRIIDEADVL